MRRPEDRHGVENPLFTREEAVDKVRSFLKDKGGATAAIMSIALVPIIGTLALSADYSKVMKQKYTLQQVVDSTATALARDTDVLLLSYDEVQTRATNYAKSVSPNEPVNGMTLKATVNSDKVHVDASGNVKLTFAKILGADSLIVNASVTVERSKAKKIELALALDNTGSMSGNKITQLKAAVKSLVDFMNDPKKNAGPTKISLVPFAVNVKTDPTWFTADMLEGTPPMSWDGCMTDRDQPHDAKDTLPGSATPGSRFWWKKKASDTNQVNCGNLARIIPLTSDLAKIKTAADTMIASGNTNVPIGLAWAWHTLSPSAPLKEGSPDGTADLLRAVILLTDGDNTQNRWGNNGGDAIDQRTTEVCTNIKAAGIVLYTIRVINGDATLLKSCATTPTHYYNVTDASQLTPVFEQIASSLSKMRISK
jgi:Flp pilus assembly protein TadG